MKKILFTAFLFIFTFLISKPAEAAHGVDIDINSTDGLTWTIVISNTQNHATAGTTPTLTFGAFWCNQNGASWCDDNSLDYRGLKTIQSLPITVPLQGSSNTYFMQFGINTRAGYPCGTAQGDVTQSSGTTGSLWWSGSNCPTSSSLVQKPSACALQATWDVGFNDNCQNKIEAGGTLYRLNDIRCNGSWDSSVNSIPAGLSVHNGGIYKLHAGSRSTGSVTLSCSTPTPTATPPGAAAELVVTCKAFDSGGNEITSATTGQQVTWTVGATRTTSPYTYTWSGDASGTTTNSSLSNSVTSTYSATGAKTANIEVKDSSSPQQVKTATCSVTINPAGANAISSPPTITRVNSTSPWPGISINTTMSTPPGNVYYKSGSGITPGTCSGSLCSGWTPVQSSVTGNFIWNAAPIGLQDGTYTFGLFNTVNSVLLAVSTSNFTSGTVTPTPTSGPPGCSLTVSSSNASVGSIINISSTNPNTPYRINVDGPNSVSYGPYTSPSGTATWYTSGWPGGSYSVSNGCASRTVNLALSCNTSGSFSLIVQTFQETNYNKEQWPQQIWNPQERSICRGGDDSDGVSTYRPPEPTLKDKIFQFLQKIIPKITLSPPIAYAANPCPSGTPNGTLCGTTSTGQNLYCQTGISGSTGRPDNGWATNSSCTLQWCKTDTDCNDNNVCTNDNCLGYVVAGLVSDEGGSYWQDEQMGKCSLDVNNNLPTTTVCQTDPTKKLCSGVSGAIDEETGFRTNPTCSVDVISCTDVRVTTDACCGLTNIQGRQCFGYCDDARFPTSWNKDSALPFNGPPADYPVKPLAGVVIEITDSRNCVFTPTQVTDANGLTSFHLPRKFRDRSIRYTARAITPEGFIFTRGVYASDASGWDQSPGFDATKVLNGSQTPNPEYTRIGGGLRPKKATFGFERSIPLDNNPWIQTTGGNVHSNDRIKSEHGP